MAQSAAQIISLATQIAKAPGFISQAQYYLNAILQELAETYDFDVNKVSSFSVTTNSTQGSNAGPYVLPANYLRASKDEVNYLVQGEPYVMTQITIAQWRSLFEGQGVSDYPYNFATDFSTVQSLGYPVAYIWPPANGSYVIQWPYFQQHTDISNFSLVPWFPLQTYLITRLSAELMRITDDTRLMPFLADAENMLRKYLIMKDDPDGYVKTVDLDRRYFNSPYGKLKATKATVF